MNRRYRRSRHLVCYWTETGAVVYNYASAVQAPLTEFMWQLLDFCRDWRSVEELQLELMNELPEQASLELCDGMVTATLFEASDRSRAGCERAMDRWEAWNPSAGLFHTVSRQCIWAEQGPFNEKLSRKHLSTPIPSSTRPPRGDRLTLPLVDQADAFASVLLDRRTWRQFGSEAVERTALARILQLTSGVTHWLKVPGLGEVPLTTSPSGGARHPIETYVAVRDVRDVTPGIYHYAHDRHELEVVDTSVSCPELHALFPQQPWLADAAFAVFFTAVFERTAWRYEFPLAYQAVLLEAGHMCQTFLLTATALGLAPFSTVAVDLPLLEGLLGLDGVSEAFVYAAGAGTRPETTARAVMPPHYDAAVTRANGTLRTPVEGASG